MNAPGSETSYRNSPAARTRPCCNHPVSDLMSPQHCSWPRAITPNA